MIIYGWRTLESEVGQGGFRCPSCKTQQAYRQFSHRTWFTLYFLPVFPLGTENSYVQCQCCYSQFGKHALRSLPAAAESPIQAVLVEEPAHSKQPRIVQAPHARPAAPLSAGVQIPIAQPLGNVIPDAPRTSSLALASLILGLISPVLLCAFGLSLLSSLAAIVTGHLALYHLKREFPRLLGQTQAITGLVLGYVLLVASIGFWSLLLGPIFRDDNRPLAQAPDTNRERLLDAEMKVTGASGDDGAATGNTAAAEALARTYSEMLAKMRNAEFTPDRERKVTLSGGKFVVHCELHPGRCALLVHVPSYRDFDSDAKEELARRSWELAQELVTPELQPGDLLAVGLRGSLLYGSVMVGKVGGAPQDGFTGSERDDLIAFFPAPAAPAAEAPAKVAEEPPPAAEPARPAAAPAVASVPPAGAGQAPPAPAWPPGPIPGQFPPGYMPPPGFRPPPGYNPPPGFAPPNPFAASPPPGNAAKAAAAPRSSKAPSAPPRPAQTLDEIVELLKSGQPTFGRLYSPLHRLRGIEPVASRREEVAALLDPLLTTGDFSVRHAAYDAVEVWGTQRNVPTLLAILDGSDRSERWPAMEALGKIGGSPEAAARLAKLMLDSGESLQAKRALEDMGAVAEDPVWQLVGNSDNLIHSYACQVLGKVGTSKSLERLKSRPKEAQTVRQVSVDLAVQDMQGRLRGQPQN